MHLYYFKHIFIILHYLCILIYLCRILMKIYSKAGLSGVERGGDRLGGVV